MLGGRPVLLILFLFSLLVSCKENKLNFKPVDVEEVSAADTTENELDDSNANVGRAIWQKPGLVISKLGNISEKVIADIGAGTGYFSFRLSSKAKKVLAIEIDPTLIGYIDSTKQKLPEAYRSRIETRLAKPDDPMVRENEADVVLIINTVAYIKDAESYFKNLKKGLKPDGQIMIIDYKMKRLPINAPPKSERIYLDVVEELLIKSGYEILQTDDTSLDYQYIIIARNIK